MKFIHMMEEAISAEFVSRVSSIGTCAHSEVGVSSSHQSLALDGLADGLAEGVKFMEKCQLEIDKEVFDRWCVIGITEALSSDTDIANFLILQYEKVGSGGQQGSTCIACSSPMSLVCPRCTQASQHQRERASFFNNNSSLTLQTDQQIPEQDADKTLPPLKTVDDEKSIFNVKSEICKNVIIQDDFFNNHSFENASEVKEDVSATPGDRVRTAFSAKPNTSNTVHARTKIKSGKLKKSKKLKHQVAQHGGEGLPEEERKRHKCELCPAAFFRRSNLVAHLVRHGVETPHKCKQCPAAFRKYAELQTHDREEHSGKNFDCQLCGAGFKHSYKLTEHMRRHRGERPYICDICGMGYINASDRNIHRRTHTGEKPYMCSTCGKTFARSGCLAVHKRTHQVEKPHVCSECGRAFKHQSHLKDHMRTHSGLRPFQCELCGKSMAHRSTLKYHMRTHTGQKPYTCPVCGKSFSTCSNMWQHRRTHKE